jgi:Tol biopolymer transport system component
MVSRIRSRACLLLAGATLGAAVAARAAYPPSARLAFVLDSDPAGRSSAIHVVNPDGKGARPVTPGSTRDRDPAFSPTGQTLAYQTNPDGIERLVIRNLETGVERPLADGGARPQWSRDGTRVLFSRRHENRDRLFVIRADGQPDRGLTPIAEGRIGRWSPDEKQLAVAAAAVVDRADRWQIRVFPALTLESGPRRAVTLPEDVGPVLSLEWAPDGKRLLYSAGRGERNELYVLDLEDSEPRRVPAGPMPPSADHGVWSPDGAEIAFRAAASGAGGGARLCLMRADGTQVRTLWEPENKAARLHGLAWFRPPGSVAVNPVVPPKPPVVEPPKPEPPKPLPPKPPVAEPKPMPPPVAAKVPGPPRKLLESKVHRVEKARSPLTLTLAEPGAAEFTVTVPVLHAAQYRNRRQGVGVTLELEDGALYRGTVIFSGQLWATLQGRPRGGTVKLIDGKQLPGAQLGFKGGFTLALRREGNRLIVSVNGEDHLAHPVLTAGVRRLSLTLENFDPQPATLPVGNVYYREMIDPPPPPAP